MAYSENTKQNVLSELRRAMTTLRDQQALIEERITRLSEAAQQIDSLTYENIRALHVNYGTGYDLSYAMEQMRREDVRNRQGARAAFTLSRSRRLYASCNARCGRNNDLYLMKDTNLDSYTASKPGNQATVCSITCARKTALPGAATAPIKVPNPYFSGDAVDPLTDFAEKC
jgi:hypothetical protein